MLTELKKKFMGTVGRREAVVMRHFTFKKGSLVQNGAVLKVV